MLGLGHFDDTGGKGANQAVAAARLGRDVAMVGMVGHDAAGRRLIDALRADGVDVAAVAVNPTVPTGMAVITVDAAGENSIVVDPAANAAFTPTDLAASRSAFGGATVVLIQLEIPLDTVASAAAAASGIVLLNPAPAAALSQDLLDNVDVLIPNATELARIAGCAVPVDAAQAIAAARTIRGPGAIVVTLGALGAVAVQGDASWIVPAPRIDPVDPTAAGDAFCGGLADALVRGEDLEAAVGWAVLCGAATATRWGAQASLPTRGDVLALEEAL